MYYSGKISGLRDSGEMHIKYIDGDKGWLDPSTDKYEWLGPNDPIPPREVSPNLEVV